MHLALKIGGGLIAVSGAIVLVVILLTYFKVVNDELLKRNSAGQLNILDFTKWFPSKYVLFASAGVFLVSIMTTLSFIYMKRNILFVNAAEKARQDIVTCRRNDNCDSQKLRNSYCLNGTLPEEECKIIDIGGGRMRTPAEHVFRYGL